MLVCPACREERTNAPQQAQMTEGITGPLGEKHWHPLSIKGRLYSSQQGGNMNLLRRRLSVFKVETRSCQGSATISDRACLRKDHRRPCLALLMKPWLVKPKVCVFLFFCFFIIIITFWSTGGNCHCIFCSYGKGTVSSDDPWICWYPHVKLLWDNCTFFLIIVFLIYILLFVITITVGTAFLKYAVLLREIKLLPIWHFICCICFVFIYY